MARHNKLQHIDYIKGGDPRMLPCPFCGPYVNDEGDSFDILYEWWYKIRCANCTCCPYSSSSDSIEKAIEFWNTRVQMASLDDAKFLIQKAIKDLSKVIE